MSGRLFTFPPDAHQGFFGCAGEAQLFGIVDPVAYPVSTPVFEGPIDLLLHLVSSHEVDILDIPLLPVVDGFVRVLTEQRDQIDFNQLSEFLLVAAILIELKSQKLLPGRESADDDDELIGWEERGSAAGPSPRVSGLRCRRGCLRGADGAGLSFGAPRGGVGRGAGPCPDLLAGVTPEELAQAYLRGSAERPVPRADLSHVTVDTVSVSGGGGRPDGPHPEHRLKSFRSLVSAEPVWK